ncbi:hypothetical protein ACPV5O_20900 [Vibrio maritimus]|uniref:hypothetical protein n=1 Tax=Vibrio maritimus TaxID=990268 RepID=UPI0040688852
MPHQIKVYPSDFEDFKQLAKQISSSIVYRYRDQALLSAFKRNDALAIAFGYKGHSDLTHCANTLASSDTNETGRWLNWRKTDKFYERISTAFSQRYDSLSEEEILLALTQAPPKQTEFEVIEGCPIVQFSPLDPDVSNEQRSEEEIKAWFNVPFIFESFDGENRTFTVECLDGGAWDRATQKAWCKTLEQALAACAQLKNDNPNYRDYGDNEATVTKIVLSNASTDEEAAQTIIHDMYKIQLFADRVKNALESVLVELPKGFDLTYIAALLENSTLSEMYTGEDGRKYPICSADILSDNELLICVPSHYFATLIGMVELPTLTKHVDTRLPIELGEIDKYISKGDACMSTILDPEAEGLQIIGYVLSDNRYFYKP